MRVLWSLEIYMFIYTAVLNRTITLTVHFSTYTTDQTRQRYEKIIGEKKIGKGEKHIEAFRNRGYLHQGKLKNL